MKKLLFVFSLLLLCSSTAFGDTTDPALTRTMEESGFSANQVLQVQNTINTAQTLGIPEDVVVGKVHEGIAKQVDPERIVQALERVTTRYEYGYKLARDLAREKSQVAPLGNSITAGIAAGLTPEHARDLVNQLQSRSGQLDSDELYSLAEETMLTARDLCRQGVSSTTTRDMVDNAVQQGFEAHEMHTMRNTFNRQEMQENRESLAKDFSRAIEHGAQAGDLEQVSSRDRDRDKAMDGSHSSGDSMGSAGGSSGNDHEGSAGSGSGSDSSGHGGADNDSGNSGGSGGDHDSSGSGSSGGGSSSGGSGGSSGGSDHGGGGESSGGGSGGGGSDHGGGGGGGHH